MCFIPGQCDIAHIFACQVASGCHGEQTSEITSPLACCGIKSVTQILLALHKAQFGARGVKRQIYAAGTWSA